MHPSAIRATIAAIGIASAAPAVALDFSRAPAQSFRTLTLPPTDLGSTGDASGFTVRSTAVPSGQSLGTLGNLANGALPKTGGILTGPSSLIPPKTQSQDGDGAMFTFQNSSTAARDIYGPQVPSDAYYIDTGRFVAVVPQGTKSWNTNAIGYYTRNLNNTSLPGARADRGNAVGIWGTTQCEVDHSVCWGLNPALGDRSPSEVNTKFDGVGRTLIGAEIDLSAQMTGTTIVGVALRGASARVPQFAGGFSCGHLGNDTTVGAGSPVIPWNVCFYASDGDVQDFAVAGALSTNATSASQRIKLRNYDASGVAHLTQIQGVLGSLSVSDDKSATTIGLIPGSSASTISAGGTPTNVSLVLQSKGSAPIVANSPVQVSGLAGSGNRALCVTAAGQIYAASGTSCP